ncbi:hypothetical protein J2T07_000111 [Luteibacter jiangsuensis]|uniref:Toxin CptA n=1 Tax=Luteibacter jiangsuensis TaxID=637577 RepID=A0ABT9SSI3_9GAMM|nr:hypothetical protein [Luteibacter jiangsuensis]MDQ0007952.1 hypothetical protein [Luteibacter jiangsuensis]
MTSAPGTGFDIRPSATLSRLGAGVVALATVAPLFTGLPRMIAWLFAAGIAWHGCRRLVAFRRPAIVSLRWTFDDVWSVRLRGGGERPADLTDARIFGTSVFLRLRWRDGRGRVALLPDNAPADDLRLLRARLSTRQAP